MPHERQLRIMVYDTGTTPETGARGLMPSDEQVLAAAHRLADLRREYERSGLTEADAGPDPFALFHRWFAEAQAAELTDPNAMILATCTPAGVPSARAVLLKALDARGFTFFTNYDSRKGNEMAANPR